MIVDYLRLFKNYIYAFDLLIFLLILLLSLILLPILEFSFKN
jgi:hypothetical protein